MNSYFVPENGVKPQIDDALFDCLWNAIKESTPPDF